jgi:hypothetical protein
MQDLYSGSLQKKRQDSNADILVVDQLYTSLKEICIQQGVRLVNIEIHTGQ